MFWIRSDYFLFFIFCSHFNGFESMWLVLMVWFFLIIKKWINLRPPAVMSLFTHRLHDLVSGIYGILPTWWRYNSGCLSEPVVKITNEAGQNYFRSRRSCTPVCVTHDKSYETRWCKYSLILIGECVEITCISVVFCSNTMMTLVSKTDREEHNVNGCYGKVNGATDIS